MTLSDAERAQYEQRLLPADSDLSLESIRNRTICGDAFAVLPRLPAAFADLLFADPPYNIDKKFKQESFRRMADADYADWLDSWLRECVCLLKPGASIYVCGDWRSSAAIYDVCSRYFKVRNRITFNRNKGRGSKSNWKNNSEDIWFCTMGDDYYFDAEAVRTKIKVNTPFTDESGRPRDWTTDAAGGKYRFTGASNIWTDLTMPFWSMAENTDHPTQKPEKLVAKVILASCRRGGLVLDPFLGSGTTSVAAKKLEREYVGIEMDGYYAAFAEKRLELAAANPRIQGMADGVFLDRGL